MKSRVRMRVRVRMGAAFCGALLTVPNAVPAFVTLALGHWPATQAGPAAMPSRVAAARGGLPDEAGN